MGGIIVFFMFTLLLFCFFAIIIHHFFLNKEKLEKTNDEKSLPFNEWELTVYWALWHTVVLIVSFNSQ